MSKGMKAMENVRKTKTVQDFHWGEKNDNKSFAACDNFIELRNNKDGGRFCRKPLNSGTS